MQKRPATIITMTSILAIMLFTLPATIAAADEQPATEQQQQMTPEQRRQEMLQKLLKLTPEDRRARQERYKTMTGKEQEQYKKDHPQDKHEE